ncbi:type 1 glutamine amidotransferase domain-containing protein [Microbulbifer sp. 2304DJ12-6]|uniref:type 1 glutamine amidotransferase domain-containing protein n=1 Tax=Microbulbifer sp. 2304DJ12-6 TaxID=3233340 RepID=UPI0039AF5BF7
MKTLMIRFLSLTTAAVLALSTTSLFASNNDIQVLMVLSSHGQKDAEGKLVKPGFEFDEMSKSYLVFASAGATITFASPTGGKLVADNYDPSKAYNERFLADKAAVKLLESTQKLSDINPKDYNAVYVVGGKGPMFDLADNQSVKNIIREVYENGGVVGAVCHGPAALLDVKLSDGSYLVEGKRVSAFTNEEESAFSKTWSMPFLLEDKLTEQGAVFHQDGLMLNQVSIDGRVITGQNPFSTADTSKAVVNKLGLKADEALEFKDDRTIKLVEQFFSDRDTAIKEFTAHRDQYDPMLLGMFGVYQARHANTAIERDVALILMQQTQDTINHPMLDTAIAKAYLHNNNIPQAKAVLTAAKKKFPENQQVLTLLQTLSE